MTQDNRKPKLINKTPGGGKIILKKINQFTDNIKLNKTYKNEIVQKVPIEKEIKVGKKSNLQKYEETLHNRKGSQLYTREAELRQDPTPSKPPMKKAVTSH
jgi:hypothetical protein